VSGVLTCIEVPRSLLCDDLKAKLLLSLDVTSKKKKRKRIRKDVEAEKNDDEEEHNQHEGLLFTKRIARNLGSTQCSPNTNLPFGCLF